MTEWNFLELGKLCKEKGILDAKIYQHSLQWRWNRADYHADTASKIWSDLFKKSFSFQGQRYSEAVFVYEAQVEACVQALHSLADMLAQIINVVILGRKLQEDYVSIKVVVKIMEKEGIAPDVAKSTRQLLDDKLFKYIEAFCNTIKHRRLIKTTFHDGYDMKSGLRFEPFVYRGDTCPQTWGSDILEKHRFQLFNLITEIGLNINKYVATV